MELIFGAEIYRMFYDHAGIIYGRDNQKLVLKIDYLNKNFFYIPLRYNDHCKI